MIVSDSQNMQIIQQVLKSASLPIIILKNCEKKYILNQAAAAIFGSDHHRVNDLISQYQGVLDKQKDSFYLSTQEYNSDFGVIHIAWYIFQDSQDSERYFLGINVSQALSSLLNVKIINRLVIDNLPNYSIFWKDKQSRFMGCNKTFAKLANINNPEDIVGKTDYDLPWAQSESDAYIKDDQAVMAMGSPKLDIEEMQTLASGEKIVLSTSKIPLKNEENEVMGVLAVYRDITDKKSKEVQLIEANQQLEHALESRNRFIRNIRHDIRTPLTGIIEIAKQLNGLELSGKIIKEYGSDIQVASEELMNLLNEIISISEGSESGSQESDFIFKDLIDSVRKIYQPATKHKVIDLSFEIDYKIPKNLFGDASVLKKILLNLVGNAVKFTLEGSVWVNCKLLKIESDIVLIEICVKDSGIGISEIDQTMIFEPFVRLNPSYQGIYRGTGMGLSYVKENLELLGGNITVNSELGVGSTFIFTLPLKVSMKEPIFFENKKETQYHSVLKNSFDLNKNRSILLVEDHMLAQKINTIKLSSLNYDVDIASCGEEAIDLCSDHRYRFIYMDIGLPDFSGIEVARRIKEDKNNPNRDTLIIALTAHGDSDLEIVENLKSIGIENIFGKPLTDEQIEITENELKKINYAMIDWSLCVSRVGGDENLAKEILILFLSEFTHFKLEFYEKFNKKDLKGLEMLVHRFRGGLAYYGFPALENAIDNLYQVIKKKNIFHIEKNILMVEKEMNAIQNNYR